jgi:hypothetical protein
MRIECVWYIELLTAALETSSLACSLFATDRPAIVLLTATTLAPVTLPYSLRNQPNPTQLSPSPIDLGSQ